MFGTPVVADDEVEPNRRGGLGNDEASLKGVARVDVEIGVRAKPAPAQLFLDISDASGRIRIIDCAKLDIDARDRRVGKGHSISGARMEGRAGGKRVDHSVSVLHEELRHRGIVIARQREEGGLTFTDVEVEARALERLHQSAWGTERQRSAHQNAGSEQLARVESAQAVFRGSLGAWGSDHYDRRGDQQGCQIAHLSRDGDLDLQGRTGA